MEEGEDREKKKPEGAAFRVAEIVFSFFLLRHLRVLLFLRAERPSADGSVSRGLRPMEAA
jgi:hypothetical protein